MQLNERQKVTKSKEKLLIVKKWPKVTTGEEEVEKFREKKTKISGPVLKTYCIQNKYHFQDKKKVFGTHFHVNVNLCKAS